MKLKIALAALLVAAPIAAQQWPNCSPSATCMVPWNAQSPLGSKPLALGVTDGQVGVSVCYLVQPPATWTNATYCPDSLGRPTITLGEWCQLLRNLPVPVGGSQAGKDAVVQKLCTYHGA